MAKHVFDAIDDCSEEIRALGPVNDGLGRLDADAVGLLRDCGVTRMLQPEEHGGFATHPGDFAEAVMRVSALDGAAGWVAGTVGAAPWALAMAPRRVRDEVWEADSDSWVVPALEPAGELRPAVDGYLLTGRWTAVPGVDHCEWALLGAHVADGRHAGSRRLVQVLVPRSDVCVVDGSWDAIGLIGTGSRTITVRGAAVPGYRVLDHSGIATGAIARRIGLRNPTYRMPFGTVFPLSAESAVVGMAAGAAAGGAASASAIAEIRASHAALLDVASRFFNMVLDGRRIDGAVRARGRNSREHAVRQAVRALDEIVAAGGSAALRRNSPLQRFWRDAHVALARLRETQPVYGGARLAPVLTGDEAERPRIEPLHSGALSLV